MSSKIDTILFDLGDTLLDFGKVSVARLFDSGGRLAYDYLQKQGHTLPPFKTFYWKNYVAIRMNVIKCAITLKDFHAARLMDKLLKEMSIEVDRENLLELCWLWYKPLHDCARIESGLVEMLKDFTQSGLKLGVVSNTFIPGETLDRHLEETGLLPWLPKRIYSCDVGWQKPKPVIFRKALEIMESNAHETLFIGDKERNDVRGAKRVGMKTVRKDITGRKRSKADFKIKSMLELRDVIKKCND